MGMVLVGWLVGWRRYGRSKGQGLERYHCFEYRFALSFCPRSSHAAHAQNAKVWLDPASRVATYIIAAARLIANASLAQDSPLS